MAASAHQEGVDTETPCKIEVRVKAYLSFIDGRREYTKGSTLCLNVDWSEYSLLDLLSDVKSKYKWASYQQVEFWYVSKDNINAKLCSDGELLSLLQGSRLVQFEMKVVGEPPNNDLQLVVHTETGPCDTELKYDYFTSVGDDGQADLEFEFLDVPIFGQTVAGTSIVEEEEKDHYIEGIDPDGDEPAGADEEWRYFKKGKKKAPENVTEQVQRDVPEQVQQGVPEQVQQDVPEQVQAEPVILPENIQDHDPDCVPDDEAVVIASSYVPISTYDRDNPKIVKGSTFVDKDQFIIVFKQFCIKNEFETVLKHSDPGRYRAVCKFHGCKWSVYAKKLLGCDTFMVVKIGPKHNCSSTSKVTGKEASAAWIANRVKPMLLKNQALGAKELMERLEDQFTVTLSYNKVWEGRKVALKEMQGTWEDSFKLLWNWKAAVEATCPGSIVEIDCKKVKGKMYFSRFFVALRPCVNGFLMGCRPYLGVDSTHLTGKYLGQLAAATSIDGHNWMYPVAYGLFDKESNGNWAWFMTHLKRAIGTPPGLTIHTDACKGLDYGVSTVFGDAAEHRECFRHLMANFRKRFSGDVMKYMWPCAWACTQERHQKLMDKIEESCPEATIYLRASHPHLWSRAKFSKICKVDYVNNNISECFNNWIKDFKDLPAVDLVDIIRVKIMEKIATRQVIASRMQGTILQSVVNVLYEKSRNLHYNITKSGYLKAEISGVSRDGFAWRYGVNLVTRTCSCGQWDVNGKPCTHAIAFITSMRNLKIEDYVHEYYSVQRFKDVYQFEVLPMGDKSQWPTLDPGFDMRPPKLEGRPAGRPKKKRIKSSGEPGKRGPYQFKRCFQYGHIEKGCTNPQVEPHEDPPEPAPTKKKRARGTTDQEGTKQAKKSRKKKELPDQGKADTSLVLAPQSSPGPVTRSRASPSGKSPTGTIQETTPPRKTRLMKQLLLE